MCITSNTQRVKRLMMSTISLRVTEEERKFIQGYCSANNINMSEFIRSAVIQKIQEDLFLDEKRIQRALLNAEKEKKYSHTEVWDMLEV